MLYYKSVKTNDTALRERILQLSQKYPTNGVWKIAARIRNEGLLVNKKKIYRIYLELGLNLKQRRKKRLPTRHPIAIEQPIQANYTWSMDFMSDRLIDGRKFRTLNIIDDYNREAIHMEISRSITGEAVIEIMRMLKFTRGLPRTIRVDNGPEFIYKKLDEYLLQQETQLSWTRPGKPSDNAYIERFNRTYREDILNAYEFKSIAQVKELTKSWMKEYNEQRPHCALGQNSPMAFGKGVNSGKRPLHLDKVKSVRGVVSHN